MRIAILAQQAPAGDAIGNLVAEKTAYFVERGADIRVFLETHGTFIRVYRIGPASSDPSMPKTRHSSTWPTPTLF